MLATELSGAIVGGYRLGELLGRGGMAVVYSATHSTLGRPAAVKILSAELAADPDFVTRFRREGRLQASLEHPNVVTVYESGSSSFGLYLAMLLVRGPSLSALLAAGEVDAGRALWVGAQVASALDAAHSAGLVHRDVKPGNVLVDGDHAYLADFGLTRGGAGSGLTAPGRILGTLAYLAPEVARGEPATPASDRYSFAALLFHCLTGSVVFGRPTAAGVLFAHTSEPPPRVSARRPALGGKLDAVFERALAKDPAERPTSATALVEEVAALVDPTLGPPPPRASPPAAATTTAPSARFARPPAGDTAPDRVPRGTTRPAAPADPASAGTARHDTPRDPAPPDPVPRGTMRPAAPTDPAPPNPVPRGTTRPAAPADPASAGTARHDTPGDPAPAHSSPAAGTSRPARGRRGLVAAALLLAALVGGAIAWMLRGDGAAAPALPPLRGTTVLGSDLAQPGVARVCPGGCTLLQTALPDATLVVPEGGVIRRWGVRSARGELALTVLREREGGFFAVSNSRHEFVTDAGPHAFVTDLAVDRGDLVGVTVLPGSAIGERSVAGAATSRWPGRIRGRQAPLAGERGEVLLRVELLPGASQHVPAQLNGAAAANAPSGSDRARRRARFTDGRRADVALVEVGDRFALDLYAGRRRVARIDVPELRPHGGRLIAFDVSAEPSEREQLDIDLEYANEDSARILSHFYVAYAREFEFVY
ncbi:serine/threonine-protein kinase [Solirubrobacter soli]|uniref:serine/threonine-protein kinase n=1 Tax=Solirubrobacter soli TaxID=363832 RepID=UPI0004086689|nr:serine/threonine-protein kinase [Solirubrobacter soli]